ncbi:MAG: arsenate reductase family protein [Verrucomicrobia bacterium]|nr:arsenate reductase family protein [Verrucomicrobiota bacterium]
MALKFYEYKKCDTCRKARKFLEAKGVSFTAIPIREQPPTPAELRRMLKIYGGNLRRLFNTSGEDYKRLNLKTKLAAMTETEAIALLAGNGNLVKRPFVLGDTGGAVGFKPEEWSRLS